MKNRKQNFTRDEGLALAKRYQESGQKRTEFVTMTGVPMATLQYWVWKLNQSRRVSTEIQKAMPFVEVVRVPSQREFACGAAVLEMPGARMRFEELPPAGYVAQIAASLAEYTK